MFKALTSPPPSHTHYICFHLHRITVNANYKKLTSIHPKCKMLLKNTIIYDPVFFFFLNNTLTKPTVLSYSLVYACVRAHAQACTTIRNFIFRIQ